LPFAWSERPNSQYFKNVSNFKNNVKKYKSFGVFVLTYTSGLLVAKRLDFVRCSNCFHSSGFFTCFTLIFVSPVHSGLTHSIRGALKKNKSES